MQRQTDSPRAGFRLSPPLQQVDRTYVLHRRGKLSYFGGCDYFRMASHPRVVQAVHRAIDDVGLNVAASRGTTGNHEIYSEIEEALADFFKAEAAVLVGSGYAANIVAAQALGGRFQHALVDERSHPSVKDALPFLDCPATTFRHRDPMDLAAAMKRFRGARVLLLTDGMFSHDGSAAPLAEYRRLLPRGTWMLVDDAHGAGVLGGNGGGTIEQCGISRAQVIQTMSLGKAFGVYGGAILCPRSVREDVIGRSRLFQGNTPLPLPLAAGAIEAVRVLGKQTALRARMLRNAEWVKRTLRSSGLDVPDSPGPIVSIIPSTEKDARQLERQLFAHAVFPSLVRYPGGPPSGYFRFMISSEHTKEQLQALANALAGSGRMRR